MRFPRRWTYHQGKLVAAFGLSLAAGHAAATLYTPFDRDILQLGVNLAVLYALAFACAYRWRHALNELVHLFCESNAHLFLGAFLVFGTVLLFAMLLYTDSLEWIAAFTPVYIGFQAVLAVFACTPRGVDRLGANALVLLGITALGCHPHAAGYAAVTLGLGIAAQVFEHFERVVASFHNEDRQYPFNAAVCSVLAGGFAALLFVGLHAVAPVSTFKPGAEFRSHRLQRALGRAVRREDAGEADSEAGWAELLRSVLNVGAGLAGVGLLLLVARALFTRGAEETQEREEEPQEEEDEAEVPIEDTSISRRHKTWIKTPQMLVIDMYLGMTERLRRHGVVRQPWSSPAEYAETLAARSPDLRGPVDRLTETFRRVRYGPWDVSREDVDAVAQAVSQIEKRFKTLE
ncbi:MAG: DUF4129 domain-containing protein [Planctomycetes bacterium]|nr:DUF4129 domain-containing protein [Planctomycetota bacterium]